MKINIIKQLKQILVKRILGRDSASLGIVEKKVVEQVINNPDFPFLVSFPRTGSHWLRMMMELYFEKPSLVRVFYYVDSQDYLTFHTHDIDLDIYRRNVIYLYRSPLYTIYSQLKYHQENLDDENKISYWSAIYGKHLSKWLIEETFSEKKTILRYENLMQNITSEFSKLTDHFGQPLDSDKLQKVFNQVSKEKVQQKTTYDKQIININDSYQAQRQEFIDNYSELIEEVIIAQNPLLENYIFL